MNKVQLISTIVLFLIIISDGKIVDTNPISLENINREAMIKTLPFQHETPNTQGTTASEQGLKINQRDNIITVRNAVLKPRNVQGGERTELLELNISIEAAEEVILKVATLNAKASEQAETVNVDLGPIIFNQTIETGVNNILYPLAAAGVKRLYSVISGTTPFSLYLSKVTFTVDREDLVLMQEIPFNGTITLERLDFSSPVKISEIKAEMKDYDLDGTNETFQFKLLLRQIFSAPYSIQSQGPVAGFKNKSITNAKADYFISIANLTSFSKGEIPPNNEFVIKINLLREWRVMPEKIVASLTSRILIIYEEANSASINDRTFYPSINTSSSYDIQATQNPQRWKVEIIFTGTLTGLTALLFLSTFVRKAKKR